MKHESAHISSGTCLQHDFLPLGVSKTQAPVILSLPPLWREIKLPQRPVSLLPVGSEWSTSPGARGGPDCCPACWRRACTGRSEPPGARSWGTLGGKWEKVRELTFGGDRGAEVRKAPDCRSDDVRRNWRWCRAFSRRPLRSPETSSSLGQCSSFRRPLISTWRLSLSSAGRREEKQGCSEKAIKLASLCDSL